MYTDISKDVCDNSCLRFVLIDFLNITNNFKMGNARNKSKLNENNKINSQKRKISHIIWSPFHTKLYVFFAFYFNVLVIQENTFKNASYSFQTITSCFNVLHNGLAGINMMMDRHISCSILTNLTALQTVEKVYHQEFLIASSMNFKTA